MTGTIFEQGQTFADEIDYKREEPEVDNDLVEEVSELKESFDDEDLAVEDAGKELNPDLSSPGVLASGSALTLAENEEPSFQEVMRALYQSILVSHKEVEGIMASAAMLGEAVDELQTRLNALVKKLDNTPEEEDEDAFYEPDDEEEIVIPAKKSGVPGRPAKQAPKLKVAKKKKAKVVAKKAVQRKPKSVKKKTKR